MKNIGSDEFELSTGKVFYANCYIIGIAEDSEGIKIYDGYDGIISNAVGNEESIFTDDEKREISEYCIGLWKKWGNIK